MSLPQVDTSFLKAKQPIITVEQLVTYYEKENLPVVHLQDKNGGRWLFKSLDLSEEE